MTPLASGLLASAIVLYGVAALVIGIGVWSKDFHYTRQVSWLWPNCWDKSIDYIQRTLITDVTRAYGKNQSALDLKAFCIQVSISLISLETLLVGIALVTGRPA